MFKGFIFDMDGTLVDNMYYHNQSWFHFFDKHNIQITQSEFDTIHKGTIIEVMQKLFGTDYPLEKLMAYGHQKEAIYREIYAPHVKALAGLHDFLDILKTKNCPIALATMGDWNNINFIFKALDIEHYFDIVISGSDVTQGKPHPEIFLKAAEGLGIAPKDALVFEDSMSGFEAACRANMAAVGLATTHTVEDIQGLGLLKVVNDYSEVREWLF
jgi:beta-phosphoglucomutase